MQPRVVLSVLSVLCGMLLLHTRVHASQCPTRSSSPSLARVCAAGLYCLNGNKCCKTRFGSSFWCCLKSQQCGTRSGQCETVHTQTGQAAAVGVACGRDKVCKGFNLQCCTDRFKTSFWCCQKGRCGNKASTCTRGGVTFTTTGQACGSARVCTSFVANGVQCCSGGFGQYYCCNRNQGQCDASGSNRCRRATAQGGPAAQRGGTCAGGTRTCGWNQKCCGTGFSQWCCSSSAACSTVMTGYCVPQGSFQCPAPSGNVCCRRGQTCCGSFSCCNSGQRCDTGQCKWGVGDAAVSPFGQDVDAGEVGALVANDAEPTAVEWGEERSQ